jgi:hypothetical protein
MSTIIIVRQEGKGYSSRPTHLASQHILAIVLQQKVGNVIASGLLL